MPEAAHRCLSVLFISTFTFWRKGVLMKADYEGFFELVKRAASAIKSLDRSKQVRLVSHLDADGLSAASIMVRALNRENMRYSLSIVQQLNEEVIKGLEKENFETLIVTDLGSGQTIPLKQHLGDRRIIIIDHHIPQEEDNEQNEKFIHVNPHLAGIDGSKEVSGAGVAYFVAEAMDEKNRDLAHIAIVGAIGDVQEEDGFLELNSRILKTAVEQKKIEVRKGLRFFGAETRPLHKVIEYSSDPYIPGVTGSESGAIQFLQSLGISPMNEKRWRKLNDLSEEEMKRLVAGIIMKRSGEAKPEDVLGNQYILLDEKEGTHFRTAKEFATVLNACGRMNKTSIGIGVCLGDPKLKAKATKVLESYRKEIVNALRWFENSPPEDRIIRVPGALIINAEDEILHTIAGTFASILAKSNNLEDNTFILSIARIDKHQTKVSLRIAGYKPREDIDLRDVIKELADAVGGEAGGHQYAAGALIPTSKVSEFIEAAKIVLPKRHAEEKITLKSE
ncbi:DHH family phosphoesterase [Candidatus Woesearchaeota archaeon]|nr:MAG: DHH family phosphoesterase [Candidatus Woesearchaeota archaeon]